MAMKQGFHQAFLGDLAISTLDKYRFMDSYPFWERHFPNTTNVDQERNQDEIYMQFLDVISYLGKIIHPPKSRRPLAV